jgi:hypothetical protein
LDFAMAIATQVADEGGYFCFEHPQSASSWRCDSVISVARLPNTTIVSFDQCRFGLRAADTGLLMFKPTKLMTNSPKIVAAFENKDPILWVWVLN